MKRTYEQSLTFFKHNTAREKRKEDNHLGLEYYVLTFDDGRTLYQYKSFVEHLLIEEVK